MLKFFIILISLLISSLACSTEVSLLCEIKSTYNDSFGDVKKDVGKAIIEVVDEFPFRMINISSEVQGANGIGVATKLPSSMQGKVFDFTTDSKWDIRNLIEGAEGKMSNRIVIDRFTGLLIVNVDVQTRGMTSQINIGGNCKKIDIGTKKF